MHNLKIQLVKRKIDALEFFSRFCIFKKENIKMDALLQTCKKTENEANL